MPRDFVSSSEESVRVSFTHPINESITKLTSNTGTDSILIPLLFSYLNDPAWELRAALFAQLPSVFMFVPSSSFLDLNILVKFLTDCQVEVSRGALACSVVMLQQFRFRQSSVLELAKHVVRTFIHSISLPTGSLKSN